MSKKLILKSIFQFIWFVVLNVLFGFSCERKINSSDTGHITIQIPKRNMIENAIPEITTFSSGLPPTSWNDVDCYGFFISGPEESMRANKCQKLNGVTGLADGEIAFGKIYGGFYKEDPIELDVPSGSSRVITTLAFKSNVPLATTSAAACRSLLRQENENFSKGFIYATSESFNVQPGSSQTVALPINYVYNSTPFVGDCSGPSAPGSGSGSTPAGPPAKMRMRFQNNLTSLNAASCVAVIFELLDANGNKPTISENISFTVSEGSGYAQFYQLNGVYCNGSGPTSKTIPFNSSSSSITLFMEPTTNVIYNFTFTQAGGSTLAIEKPENVQVYDNGVPSSQGPFKISIFDLHSFKGTNESLVSSPIKVRANECRPAVVQLLDVAGRPVRLINSHGSMSYISLLTIDSSFGVSASSSSTCSPSQITDTFTLLGSTQNYFLNRFYYKAPSGNSGQYFSMKTQNTGSGYYHPGSATEQLDPTAAVNNNSYWKIE